MNATTTTTAAAARPVVPPTSLHEVLAAEKDRAKAADKAIEDVRAKFRKGEMFEGKIRTLRMVNDSHPNKERMEAAESKEVPVVTGVIETLDYALNLWAKAEDVRATKNATNCIAKSHLILDDRILLEDVPVDELMGLEKRLESLRALLSEVPSISARRAWRESSRWPIAGLLEAPPETANKTESTIYGIQLSPATEKHPAQIKEASRVDIIGTFTDISFTAALTTDQKAKVLSVMDDLIVACRAARNRANSVSIVDSKVGQAIKDVIMGALK